jgi:hypothetical protein
MAHPNGPFVLTLVLLAVLCILLAFTPSDRLRNSALLLAGFLTMVALGSAIIFYVLGWSPDAALCALIGGVGLLLTVLTSLIVRWTENRLRASRLRRTHR